MSEHLVLLVGMTIFHNFNVGLEDGPSRKYDKGPRRLKAYYETFGSSPKDSLGQALSRHKSLRGSQDRWTQGLASPLAVTQATFYSAEETLFYRSS
jgi:hypothetical protein